MNRVLNIEEDEKEKDEEGKEKKAEEETSPLQVEDDKDDISQTTVEKSVEKEDDCPKGFARGLEPETILGATNETGEIIFLVKWKNCNEADFVRAKEANVKIPNTVIKFYEDHSVMGKEYDFEM